MVSDSCMEDEAEGFVPQRPTRRTVSLRVFVAVVIVFVLALLVLGLGLGLGLPRSWPSSPSLGPVSSFGLPNSLATVSPEQLVNTTELDLKTGFIVSDSPTTREYEFNITQAYAAPDGFYKPMILVNGQSPGPLVEANNGDTIRVRVSNQMSNSSTAIHWHGIDQRNTTWMDGVTGVTQCGIPPGESFTYEFQIVDQRGTFWYHAHQSVQYTDGLYGPIVIHDPDEKVPPVDDDKIVFLGDHYHTYGSMLVDSYLKAGSAWSPDEAGVEPLADNLLINGRHTYNCSVESTTYPATSAPPCAGSAGTLSRLAVRAGTTTRLRLVSHSSFLSFWFSIDNHTLTVVEVDGHEVAPLQARGVYVNIGQRYSVLVRADGTPGTYVARATVPQTCFVPYSPYRSAGLESTAYQARALLVYDGSADADADAAPIGVAGNTSNPYGVDNNGARGPVWEGCDDMPFDMPVPLRRQPAVAIAPANAYQVYFQFRQVGPLNRIFINRTSWSPYTDDAQLWQALDQTFESGRAGSYNSWDFRLDQQVLLIPEANKGVQIAISSRDIMEHPFHLHFQIVGWGPGQFDAADGANSTTWSLENPMRRDTVTVPAQSHVVVRFVADNPGIWALHCHVAWHVEGGMFVTFLERPEDLKALVEDMDPTTRNITESFCAKRLLHS